MKASEWMIPVELTESLRSGDSMLCIGSEISMAAGLEGWPSLIRPLAQTVGAHWPKDDGDLTAEHLVTVTQYYENRRGRNALINHMRKTLGGTRMLPTPVHHLIASLPVRIIFTTNYDDLLEQAFRQAGKRLNVIVNDSDLAFWSEDAVQLVKLLGDLGRPDSIVITQRDFNTYFSTHLRIAERLRSALESKSVLYLGYNLQDPFFNQIWDNISLDFGRLRRQGYAVLFDSDALQVDSLRQRSIQVVNLEAERWSDKPTVLEQWLSGLIGTLAPTKSDSTKEVDAPLPPRILYGTGNRWAVLVGVNEYEDKLHYNNLQVCINDVDALYQRLTAGGFDPSCIRLFTDTTTQNLPTRENILTSLKLVADATEPDDLLLFYYSGHGDISDNESYLVTRNGRALVLSDTALSLSRVKELLEAAPAKAKVIILDSCHSGVNLGGKGPKRMSEQFIQHVFKQAEGLAILASCKQGQLSHEWQARERSVFTHFLLEALAGQADWDKKGFVTVQDANRFITDGVKTWAVQHDLSQIPTLQYTVAGDIILCRY